VLPWWWLPVPLLLAWLAVPLAAADLARHRLPDALTLPAYPVLGLAVALAAACGPDPGLGLRAVLGVLLFGGAHAVVRVLAPAALGAGDVKLAGSLGAVLGALGWAALVVAAVLAAVITLLLALGRRRAVAPHGPGLLLATWLVAAFPGGHLATG
jgi:leader peptidase (prepilin peptidase)/N-methyltransferase